MPDIEQSIKQLRDLRADIIKEHAKSHAVGRALELYVVDLGWIPGVISSVVTEHRARNNP